MIPEMEVAGSGTMLVGSIRTPKPRQSLYIQMIMIRIQNHIIKISRTYYLFVSNKTSYVFMFSTNIYCQQGLMRISNQTSHPKKKRTKQLPGRCAADVLFAHRNAHCNVPKPAMREGWGVGKDDNNCRTPQEMSLENEKTPGSLRASENTWKLMVGRKTIRLPFWDGKKLQGQADVKLQVGNLFSLEKWAMCIGFYMVLWHHS